MLFKSYHCGDSKTHEGTIVQGPKIDLRTFEI